MNKKLKIGIIGTGLIAHPHSRGYKKLDNMEMVGLCDIKPGKAEKFAEEENWPQAQTFTDHREMLEKLDLDAVSVCTPNGAHAEVSIACLETGVNVLCEKPMSVTLEEAVDMVRTAKKSGKILSIGFQPRYNPNLQEMNRLVQSGVLGEIYYVETVRDRRRGIPGTRGEKGSFISQEKAGLGAVADIGCYAIDKVMNALEYPEPLSVSATLTDYFGKSEKYSGDWPTKDFEVEDFGTGFVRLEGEISLYIKTSWAMHMDNLGATFFLGDEAGLKFKNNSSLELYHDFQGHQTHTPISLNNQQVNEFDEKVKDFVRAVREGDDAPIPGSEIIRNQAIIDGMARSAECGHEVEIDIPEI